MMRLSCGIGRLPCVQWPMGARTRSGSQRLCLDDAEKAFVYPLGTCSGDGWELRKTHERGLHPRRTRTSAHLGYAKDPDLQ